MRYDCIEEKLYCYLTIFKGLAIFKSLTSFKSLVRHLVRRRRLSLPGGW